jgi:hypothetical protein
MLKAAVLVVAVTTNLSLRLRYANQAGIALTTQLFPVPASPKNPINNLLPNLLIPREWYARMRKARVCSIKVELDDDMVDSFVMFHTVCEMDVWQDIFDYVELGID